MGKTWSVFKFLSGDSGKELIDYIAQNDYSFTDFLWLLNLNLCSKEFNEHDIPKLNTLLIELNPYLLVNTSDLNYPKSYKEDAIKFLKAGCSIEPNEKYLSLLKTLLSERVKFCSQVIPDIYARYKEELGED